MRMASAAFIPVTMSTTGSPTRVGSPPDDFSPSGQDWSFPPPNQLRHLEDGYRLFRESIRKSMRHGGALRIDHVMRLFRLYWIPEGQTAAQGAYARAAEAAQKLGYTNVQHFKPGIAGWKAAGEPTAK